MGLAVIEWLPGAAVPLTFWLRILGAVFLAAGLGFLAGAAIFWRSSRSRLRRAMKQRGQLVPVVRENLTAAFEASRALKDCRDLVLSEEETSGLSQQRDALLETLNEIVELQQQVAATLAGNAPTQKPREASSFEIDWQCEPVDDVTGLPGIDAMADNLNSMLSLGTENRAGSGLLFVQWDGYKQVIDRHGEEAAETLLKKFVRVIIRAVREQDLVCRYAEDTVAVLLPSLDDGQGPTLAHAVRKSIRSHNFRINESGPMILLNAHYGYTDCLPHENDDLVQNRAGDALEKSKRRGFNRLHIHDGESLQPLETA